eukprot:NODE_953_length_540_cov_289.852300_g943_i0.p1 GENE.NODE_953_length_540_cov_289.852300_g943_i0~~NODE_953_length_540_cov_289.852300_g943_i0.p1  ORF type:complete len:117 (-),score=23.38 NODE_953_length_540_cov_289.852300_g943_i0:124-474(-)
MLWYQQQLFSEPTIVTTHHLSVPKLVCLEGGKCTWCTPETNNGFIWKFNGIPNKPKHSDSKPAGHKLNKLNKLPDYIAILNASGLLQGQCMARQVEILLLVFNCMDFATTLSPLFF